MTRTLVRWMTPVAAVGLMTLIKLSVSALRPAHSFVLYFGAVAVAAWVGGRIGGFLATALAIASAVALSTGDVWDLALRAFFFAGEGIVVTLLIDLLDRRQREVMDARAASEASRFLTQSVIETAPSAIVGAEPDGTVFLFNKAAEDLTGYRRADVMGQSLLNLFVPREWQEEVLARFQSPDPAVLGQPHRNPWRTRSGEERLIEWRCAVLPSRGGSRIVGVGVDVTELSLAEAEREQLAALERTARAEAEAAVQAKDRFLATVTHELKGPLTAILGWAQMLKQTCVPNEDGELHEGLRVIEDNARAQAKLVDDLLDYARIVVGKADIDRRPLKVYDVVRSAVDAFTPEAERKRLEIRNTIDGDDVVVEGDERRLRQVFMNILQNAIRYTDSGHIEIRSQRTEASVRILIRDTGRGIAPEYMPFLFEKFSQEATGRESRGGLGLGLAIVKEVVALHGGSVEAESAGHGTGAQFTIQLPVAEPALT